MSEIINTKTYVAGGKNVTSTTLSTPAGDIEVKIGVRGYKSSENGETFNPPTDKDEPEGAEEQTQRS